jgi:hypothetical protein
MTLSTQRILTTHVGSRARPADLLELLQAHDLELKHIVDIMLRVEAGVYSFETANPRHEHGWRVWEEVALPPGKAWSPASSPMPRTSSSTPRSLLSASSALPASSGGRM